MNSWWAFLDNISSDSCKHSFFFPTCETSISEIKCLCIFFGAYFIGQHDVKGPNGIAFCCWILIYLIIFMVC